MGTKRIYILLVLLAISVSCSNYMDEKGYLNYLSSLENGLRVEQKVNSFIYSAQLLTNDWYKIKASRTESQSNVDEGELLAEDEVHLIFMISTEDASNPIQKEMKDEKEYSERLVQMNMHLEKLFTIEQNGKTVDCSFALSEANYLIMSKINITLAFEGVDREKDFILRFNDRIWKNGPIKFKYEKGNLKNINRIKLRV